VSIRRAVAALCAAAGLGLASALPAAQPAAADQPFGPPLSVTRAQLDSALRCHGDLAASPVEPVLFIPGTTSDSLDDWSWNWNRAFEQRHWAYCDLDLPDHANGDIQTAAEYVVAAVRTLHGSSGGRAIGMVGHSQGGMIGRWALKYWPDTRGMVADYVGLSGSNHGSEALGLACALGCEAAYWQQASGSAFLRALNTGPQTWPGVDYTEIATHYDEKVVPWTSAYLPAADNVTDTAVQDLCPTETVEHMGMSYDNAAWLIGVDALTHPGPAVLSRVSRATCGDPFMPGVDPVAFPVHATAALAESEASELAAPRLAAEPPLRGYAQAG